MKKLMTTLMAGAFAVSLGGFAFAADEQPGDSQQQREQEYLAALKKCDSLPAAEKAKCVETAKKRYGQM